MLPLLNTLACLHTHNSQTHTPLTKARSDRWPFPFRHPTSWLPMCLCTPQHHIGFCLKHAGYFLNVFLLELKQSCIFSAWIWTWWETDILYTKQQYNDPHVCKNPRCHPFCLAWTCWSCWSVTCWLPWRWPLSPYLLLSTSRIDLYEPCREFLMHIMRAVSAQNQTQYMQYSALPLHKLIIWTNLHSKKKRGYNPNTYT